MAVAFAVAYAAVGLAIGGSIGYAVGRRSVGHRRRFWLAGGSLMAICVVANYVGLVTGQSWLRIGSLCAMAGAITGLKYGGLPDVRIWETPTPPASHSPEQDDAPASEDAGAP